MFDGNNGALWVTSSAFEPVSNVRGDYNGDGQANQTDVDLLFDAVSRVSVNSDYILSNAVAPLSPTEVQHFVENELGTSFGDANLDGSVDAADFNIWNAHHFKNVYWVGKRRLQWRRSDRWFRL